MKKITILHGSPRRNGNSAVLAEQLAEGVRNKGGEVRFFHLHELDIQPCTGCETCVDRCQMEAIEVVDGISTVLLNRCIGCGLCVTTCPTEAIQLVKKDDDKLYEPPKSGVETYMRIMQERGIL